MGIERGDGRAAWSAVTGLLGLGHRGRDVLKTYQERAKRDGKEKAVEN